ncbi:MAG: type III secretion system export apparatus subunit SctU [Parachlamydiales bacterium]|nr:type III secretion system export apparatus subunit SctU [Parachlamydiales bacterium]
MAEKSEKATPKKLRDARKKGQVAKSQDFPSAFTFVTSILGTLFAASYIYKNLTAYIVQTFTAISSNLDLANQGGLYILQSLEIILRTSFPIMLIVSFVGIIVNFLIVGPLFSMEAMKFDLKRLNPVEGIKQKFKLKVLVELIKSILKISGAAIIIGFAIWKMLPNVIQSSSIPSIGTAFLLQTFLKRISIQVGIFFFTVALFDLFFQKRTFAKEMMMEKFEVKQEYKDTEGDPLIKSKRRETFREIAYSEGPSATRRARAIITNPTHIAVAVGYEKEKDPVPVILTMGQGPIAEAIIKIAVDEHIPIMRNVTLAQELFKMGKIADYIPEETYQAVAEILKWIEEMEKEERIVKELFR